MASQTVASLAEQCHVFQDKISADIAGIETQLFKLIADLKEEFVQAHKHRATTDLAINELQDSVQMLINHFRLGTTEPSSTSAVLSSSSTLPSKGGLLPNPSMDQQLKAVPQGIPNQSTGLLIGMPKAQLQPIFSFGSMPQPNHTQHTMGSPLVDDNIPIPTSSPRPHDKNFMHRHLDFEIARHAKPCVFPEPRHFGDDLRTQWIEGLSHPHTRLHSLADHVRHGSRQSSLFSILTRTSVPCLRNGWFHGGKYDAYLEELKNATCLFTLPWDFHFFVVYSSESSSFRRRRMMQDA